MTNSRGLFHHGRRSESNPARVHNNNNNNNNNDGGGSGDNDSRLDWRDGISLFFFFTSRPLLNPSRSPSRSPSLSLSLSHSIYQDGPKGPFLLPISFLPFAPRLSLFLSLPALCPPLASLSPCSQYSRVKHGREGDETTDTRTRTPLAQASTFDPAPDMRR